MMGLAQRKTINCLYSGIISPLFLIFCLLVITVPFHSFASSRNDAVPTTEEELYQFCKSIYAQGKFADASQHIERFLSLYPESKHAGEMLFMQAFLQFALDVSIKAYELIIGKYPDSNWAAESHFQLGQSYYLQGEYDKALDHYGKIIISYAESDVYWPALYWKCKSLIAKGEYGKAVPVLRSLENGDTAKIGRDTVLMSLGNCYRGMEDYKNAEVSYRSLVDSMPDSQWIPSAYLLLARSLQDRDKIEEAEALYRKIAEDFSQSIEAGQAQEHLSSLLSSQSKPASGTPETAEPTPAASKTVGATHASPGFTIQVGAFISKRNADNLADRLKKKGYSVYILRPIPGKSRLHKVRVGTFKTRSAALRAARTFSRNERIDTEVVWQSGASD
jgi:TolA-binding protein